MDYITTSKPKPGTELAAALKHSAVHYAADWQTAIAAASSWAYAYLRISQDKAKTTESVTNQLNKLVPLLAESYPHAALLVIFTDNDVSSAAAEFEQDKVKERVEFANLLATIRAHGGRCQGGGTVWTDRMMRDPVDGSVFVRVCRSYMADPRLVQVFGQPFDFDNADDRIRAMFNTFVGWMEIEKMRERHGLHKNSKRAGGAAPCGRWDGAGFGWQRTGVGQMAQVPPEAAALRKAAQMVLAGSTLMTACRFLHEQGFRSRSGAPFAPATLGKILTSPTTGGKIPPCKGDPDWHDGNWEPILPWETCQEIAQVLRERAEASSWGASPGSPGRAPRYLLTGKLACGVCGSSHVRAQGQKDKRGYVCLAAYHDRPDLPEGQRSHVFRLVRLVDAYVTARVVTRLAAVPGELLTDKGEDLEAARAALAALEARKELHFQACKDGHLDHAEYARIKAELNPMIEQARAAINLALGPDKPLAAFAGDQTLAGVTAVWDDAAGLDERRLYVDALIDTIILKPPGRGRPKGSGVGLPRGSASYFRNPPQIIWRGQFDTPDIQQREHALANHGGNLGGGGPVG
jgi:site-specific DNA recombinase